MVETGAVCSVILLLTPAAKLVDAVSDGDRDGGAGAKEGGLGCCGAATGTEVLVNTGCKLGSIKRTRPPGRRIRAISLRKRG